MTSLIAPLAASRVAELLQGMATVRAAVVGDLMLDRYLMGDVERISPEAPVPVLSVEAERLAPGGAANVAANLAALGAGVALVGVVGDDDAATLLRQVLDSYELSTEALVTVAGRPTTTKTRIIARGQQVVRIDREVSNPLAGKHRDMVVEAAHRAIADADVLILEDYDKGVLDLPLLADLIATAREQGIPIVADPKERHFRGFAGVTVFKPNRRELTGALRTNVDGEESELREAREALGVEHLLLTLGPHGMALVSPDGSVRRSPSMALEVFDVSGAGDTVSAWVGAALAAGATIDEAAWLANIAAGIEVTKQGTATVSPNEVTMAVADLAEE
jgi:rfaE bifunctional protein kinase chain/domain